MNEECRCENYQAGARDVRQGRSVSPYQLIYLRHPGCYRAGQHDERRSQLAEERQRHVAAERENEMLEYQSLTTS
jgi:hypothetical protein